MKKLGLFAAIALSVAILVMPGCAFVTTQPLTGGVFTDLKFGGELGSGSGDKMGTAEGISVLGWVAVGDVSTSTAAADGGITNIHHVDYHAFSVLGVFARLETYVYGS